MPCQTGFVEVDGECVYDFTSDVNADGTPKTDKKGKWWETVGDYAKEYGDDVLIILGTWWQNKQNQNTPPPPNPGTPPPGSPPAAQKSNTWLYVGIGVAVLLVAAVLLVRRKGAAAPALPA